MRRARRRRRPTRTRPVRCRGERRVRARRPDSRARAPTNGRRAPVRPRRRGGTSGRRGALRAVRERGSPRLRPRRRRAERRLRRSPRRARLHSIRRRRRRLRPREGAPRPRGSARGPHSRSLPGARRRARGRGGARRRSRSGSSSTRRSRASRERLRSSPLQGLRPGLDGPHLRAQEAHALDVRALAPHVLGSHVDDALEVEARADGRDRDAVLARARLGDDAPLAEAPGEQGLAERVVELVRAGVQEILALEVEPLPGRESLGQGQGGWPPG